MQLPLNGRTFITLAALAPGVALPPNSLLPRINGGRPRTNEYLFDGISVLQPEPGQVAYYPVIDAIQEFKIESNSPPAEFGRFNGGVVNLTTKAGTNDVPRHRLRVLSQRSAQRPELLPVHEPGEAGVPAQSIRRHAWRACRQRPHVLLRGLPGPAPVHRPDGDFHRADAAAAAGNLHRGDRRASARHLRPGHDRRLQSHAVSGQHDSARPRGSGGPRAAAALPAATSRPGTANNYRRTESEIDNQHQWDARLDHTFGSNRDQIFGRLSNFRGRFVPVTPLARRQWRHQRDAGTAGHGRVGVRVELPAHVLGDRC